MNLPLDWMRPAWDAPANVRALFTGRSGGVSKAPFGAAPGTDGGLNLGAACGDDPAAVQLNRAQLAARLPSMPAWLAQVHGAAVVEAEHAGAAPPADAATSVTRGTVCAVLVADCLPVLLADTGGRVVGAAHAGWRGLAAGVIQATVNAMRARLADPRAEIVAWLGPAIGPTAFEVGPEVRDAVRTSLPAADAAFVPAAAPEKLLADLPALARQALAAVAVTRITGGNWCTVRDAQRFYSFRRDRSTGRHAALIWLD